MMQQVIAQEEWNNICVNIRDLMATHVSEFVTPISKSDAPGFGEALGTGGYLRIRGAGYLLTNEHVAVEAVGFHLGHIPGPTDDYVVCHNPILTAPWPTDVAFMRLDSGEPSGSGHDGVASSRLDVAYAPDLRELMFWLGYPGTTGGRHDQATESNTRYSRFGVLHTPGVPVLVQEAPLQEHELQLLRKFDRRKHVALHYPSAAIRATEDAPEQTRSPIGMSGSLLWDTKFVACATAGIEWNPEKARVCGLLWAAHPRPEVVVATKIEHIRPVLLEFLRQEAAYFHCISANRIANPVRERSAKHCCPQSASAGGRE